jgi:hypothetical protein
MAPPTKKQINRGFHGFQTDDAEFLRPCDPDGNWTASASGVGYNGTNNDDSGHRRGANWDDTDTHGLRNKLSDEHSEVAHERLAALIDGQYDQPAGELLGGGGSVSDNASNNSPGWKGSGRKGPRYAPKTGPQTNMTGWKK